MGPPESSERAEARPSRAFTAQGASHGCSDDSWKGVLPPAPPQHHSVQFYEDENFLNEVVGNFLGKGFEADATMLVVASEEHCRSFSQQLSRRGIAVDEARARGQLILLDAGETLATFMVDGMPDWPRFRELMGACLETVRARRPQAQVRAYGEMVNLLWQDSQYLAAIRLEEFWNALARAHAFELLCAYRMHNFGHESHRAKFQQICAAHSQVVPAEDFDVTAPSDVLLRQVSVLQQRARALEGEIQRRRAVEEALREALVQRQEVDEALRASERELLDFFENAVEGLHRVGPDGTILSANRAELAMLGYTREEYIGHHISEFHADPQVARDILARLARNEVLQDCEARLRCKDGSDRFVLINSNALFRDGQFVHSRCFTRDITQQKRLEQELRVQNEDLSRTVRFSETFIGILGHDLRNPLSGITMAASLLARRADSERVATPAKRILNSGRRMARMIDQLLDFTRIRLGKGLPLDRGAGQSGRGLSVGDRRDGHHGRNARHRPACGWRRRRRVGRGSSAPAGLQSAGQRPGARPPGDDGSGADRRPPGGPGGAGHPQPGRHRARDPPHDVRTVQADR